MKAVILAGGMGTRLRGVTGDDVPKPMVRINGIPLLERQIRSLKESGFDEAWLVVGYLGDVIKDYFGNGERLGVKINYIFEEEPLGTAGGLFYLRGKLNEPFALIFGDLLFDIEWSRFFEFHNRRKATISLFIHPNSHPYDSDIVLLDDNGLVKGFLPKGMERSFWYSNKVNAGLYVVDPSILNDIQRPEKMDFEKDLLSEEIIRNVVFGYSSPEYVKDVGTPERLTAAESDLRNGIPSMRNLSKPQRAIFLDRDGTINVLKGFLSEIEDFELEEGAAEALRTFSALGFLNIVITNQPVIARGECSIDALDEIHRKMETLLGDKSAYIDDLFYCPHHPDSGFAGEIKELKGPCDCRKPGIGLVRRAEEKYNIDLRKSWFVGDSTLDIQTGSNAGTHTALIQTGVKGKDGKYDVQPERVFATLLDFANFLKEC